MRRFKLALLATLVIAQIADLMTTNAFLHRGGTEANPVMAWVQHEMGSAWAIPKLGISLLILWMFSKAHTKRQMTIVTVAVTLASFAPLWNEVLHLTGLEG
jgi:hypothetical protein